MTCDDTLYRPSVGLVIFNAQGLIFIAERIQPAGAWQLPQGGIDADETPEVAVFREMQEEIGTRNAQILAVHPEWLYYDLPSDVALKLWNGRWKGQRQKWIALRFTGHDQDICLDADHHPEFRQWKWAPADEVLASAAPFKQEIYDTVLKTFAKFSTPIL